MAIPRTAGIVYALAQTVNYWQSGVGASRREAQRERGGQSPFVHSSLTLQRYVGCLNDFKNFCKDNGVNRIDKINPTTLASYYQLKEGMGHGKENGQRRLLSEKTMKIHLAAQTKFFAFINRPDLINYITENRGEIIAPCRPFEKTEALTRPEAVIAGMKDEPHRVMGFLQLLTGARVGDLKKMFLSGNRLFIPNSKGGRDRVNYLHSRPEDRDRVEKLLISLDHYLKSPDWGWAKMLKTYGDDYREGCRKAGERQVSPHAFRASYACLRGAQLDATFAGQTRSVKITVKEFRDSQKVERYIDNKIAKNFDAEGFYGTLLVTYNTPAGKEKETEYKMSDYRISRDLGHNRTEMTRYYRNE